MRFFTTKTLGNFIVGLYLLATRSFKVENYVDTGSLECTLREAIINYTKVLTVDHNVVSHSNFQSLHREKTSFTYQNAKKRLIQLQLRKV
jgi:hypothetical protein